MVQTIRICSAAALLLLPVEAVARRADTVLSTYARARAADRANDNATAVASYSAALTLASDVTMVAFRAYRAGVDGGDYNLALRAAQALERVGIVPADAHLLLYIAAVRDRDWSAASTRLKTIAEEEGFDFLAPLLGRWLDQPSQFAPGKLETPTAYAAESDALVAIARGDRAQGVASVRSLWSADAYRSSTLRLAAAATLASRGATAEATALLTGDDPSAVAGRARIAAGKSMSGAVDTPARGAAFLLARMAIDLIGTGPPRPAITLARLATFADPQSAQVALVMATALASARRHDEALAITERVASDPVYADLALGLRIDRLEALERTDEAIAAAHSRAGRSVNDLSRLGDIEARRGRHVAAAGHYRRAVDAIGESKAGAPLWLALGNALDQSGDWAAARPALERALALTPGDPRLLNQLGYGMADRGERLDHATALLTQALAVQPESAAISDSLGWAHFRAGRTDRALLALERARVLDPADPEIAEHLGDVYWSVGRRIEARYAWKAARDGAGDRDAMATRLSAKIGRLQP